MKFKEFINKNNEPCISIDGIKHFLPSDIFECGQAFRFNQIGEEYYEGVAFGRYIRVRKNKENDAVTIENTTPDDFRNVWFGFFDLGTDYGEIIANLPQDPALSEASANCGGIRILRQEPFETLISYIISANNNIPRIKKIVEALCFNFGDKIEHNNGAIYYSFPTAGTLAALSISELEIIKAGFRHKYILDAAKKIDGGIISLGGVYTMNVADGAKELMRIGGVGPKVASCALLFAYHKLDAFPIDVWICKILNKYYPDITSPTEYFGAYAGVANSYLFYNERKKG